jgi:peptidyl-prolyl cis-trans isomerase C
MKSKFIPLLVVGTALLAGCNQDKAADTGSAHPAATAPAAAVPSINKADAIAVVNGQYIAKSTLETLEKEIAERSHGQSFPKEKLIEELVQRELLVQDAIQKKLDKSPELAAQLEAAKKALLTQAELQNFIKTNPVTDAEVKAEYDSKIAAEKGTEYKARHILVKTEAEAKKLIAELDKGADFAKLANKNSLDAKDSQNGGDLGWFSAGQMVAPFSEAVAALEKGKYSKEPVKTQFGFHVILKEDSRPLTPPSLEAVKDQLMPFLQRKKVQGMIEALRKQAKVEILVPLTEEKPKVEAIPAPAATAAQPASEAAKAPATAEPAKAVGGAAAPQQAPAAVATQPTAEKPAAPVAQEQQAKPAATEKAPEPAKTAAPAPAAPAEPKK